jgi:HD-GYP domain-containing protein (c-di-GMP phosphodiesterase class II)
MIDSIERNPNAFVWLARIKDYHSHAYAHAINVAVWATMIGRAMGMDQGQLQHLVTGGLCLDIGKLKLPGELLEKRERLSDTDWKLVQRHVEYGVEMLNDTPGTHKDVIAMVATHHERYDGSGYPARLSGDEIPIYGQIAGIVDFFTAVTNPRPAGHVVPTDFAVNVLQKQRGTLYSDSLVDIFVRICGLYPTGALVELSTGEIAMVVGQNPERRLRPRLILLLDQNKKPIGGFPILDLFKETQNKKGAPLNIVRGVRQNEYDIDLSDIKL